MRQPEKHQVGENIEVVNAGWTFEGIAEDFDEHVNAQCHFMMKGMNWCAS